MKKALIPLVEWLSKLSPGWQNFILGTLGVVAALGPLLIIVASVAEIIGLFTNNTGRLIKLLSGVEVGANAAKFSMVGYKTAVTGAGTATNLALGPIGWIILAITTLTTLAIAFEKTSLPRWLKDILAGTLLGPIGGLINMWYKHKEAIDKTRTSIDLVKQAQDQYVSATTNLHTANLTRIIDQNEVNRLTAEIAQLQKDGKTDTDEYRLATAQLAVAHDNLKTSTTNAKNAQNDFKTATNNAKDILSKSTGVVKDYVGKVLTLGSAIKSCPVSFGPKFDSTGIDQGISKISTYVNKILNIPNIKSTPVPWLQYKGGIIGYKKGGIPGYAGGNFVGGQSALADRVPAMLTPGEGVMSKKAIQKLLQTGEGTGGRGVTYNINISPGVMIATPGEQREFARQIKKILEQDNSRYTQPRNAFTGMKTSNLTT